MGLLVKHLTPSTNTGRRTFRRKFPDDLQGIIGRREHKVPSGLEAPSSFLARYEQAAASFQEIVGTAQRKLSGANDVLDDPTIAYLAKVFDRDMHQADEKAVRGGKADLFLNGWQWMLDEYREWRVEQDLEAAKERWGRSATALLEAQGLLLDPSDREGFLKLCMALNDAAIGVGADAKAGCLERSCRSRPGRKAACGGRRAAASLSGTHPGDLRRLSGCPAHDPRRSRRVAQVHREAGAICRA